MLVAFCLVHIFSQFLVGQNVINWNFIPNAIFGKQIENIVASLECSSA